MGLFDHIMGNASEVNLQDVEREFMDILTEDEQVQAAFKLFRDKWVFTNRRLIMQNVQGITGSKKEYHSIPYKSIYQFSVETAGTLDTDCELKLWVAGSSSPYEKELKKGVDVKNLQKVLTHFVCK